MCTPIVGVHMACSVLGMAYSPCTPFQRGVQRLHAVFIRRADGRAHALWACGYQAPRIIHSTSVIFPEFQQLPVKKNMKKGNLDFILNQVALKLGEEETEIFARNEEQILAELEINPDRRLPSNIKKALAGKEWDQ
ncbi:hypothetical protein PCANC_27474 [Puccinia coronata f. sp. avenae]|uniref:Uncharacterized protein n=1 Tax=Puccinia coronata f. sp. avenae TaxID=200324 RepID=A0A2N5TVX9_9BASI|nr:hypothetical protein PCASD_26779 [Puccinia coronata f. sp. avenae]PLW29651.1 hypothetical protein PCANC_27474 [Puccinia coronata f. sp. avenae]